MEVLFHPPAIKLLFLIERKKKLTYPSSSRWSLPNPEYYTLRYADGPQLYITEQVSLREQFADIQGKSGRCIGLVSQSNTVTNPGGAASLLSKILT